MPEKEVRPTLDGVLAFLDDLSFDDQHLWAIYENDEIQWQVHWNCKDRPSCWKFVKQSDLCSFQLTTPQVLPFLNNQSIDQAQLQQALVESILTMACFADTFQRNALSLLGAEVLDNALQNFSDFSAKLLEITNAHTNQNRPELKVLRDQ